MVPEGGRVLVIENGVYGERVSQICQRYGIDHQRLVGSWMEAPDVDAIAQRLDTTGAAGGFTHLAMVHHETTTGRLNDLKAVSDLCRARGVMLLLDGVSSFGAEAIDFDDPSLAAVAATANKCLHGVPGVAFVIARRLALQRASARTYYLDLARLAKLQDERSTPFTPAVHAHYALVEALREFEEEGGRLARHARYLALAEQVRLGLAALGIESVLPAQQSSVVLRAYRLPEGVDYATLHDTMKNNGFVIYAGQGDLSKSLFRISTMGAVSSDDMERLVSCFIPWAVPHPQPAHLV
jgi:2-aminoethylphosphonate-pyruvate transaminase